MSIELFCHRLQKETSFLSIVLCLMKGLGFLEVLCKYLTRNIWFVCCSLKWTSSSEVGPFILARICSLIFVSSHKAKYLYSIPSKYQIFSSRDLRISFFIFHYCECLFHWLLGCISWKIGQDFSSYCDIGKAVCLSEVQQIWSSESACFKRFIDPCCGHVIRADLSLSHGLLWLFKPKH